MKLLLGSCTFLATALLAAGAAPASRDTSGGACPNGVLRVGTNGIAPASTSALAHEAAKTRPQVRAAVVAIDDSRGRGGAVKAQCGTAVARRTVVVYITLRALLPSASLSERVSYVARFRGGWRVWEVAH